MRLLFSRTSPYSAKVRMAAHVCGIRLEETTVDTSAEPDELMAANPLGKIPVVVLDDGRALYDSPVICEYFDRLSGNRIVPQSDDAWMATKRLEAAADGIMDAAVLVVYEGRFRPEEKRYAPWVDRQWRRVARGLAAIGGEIGEVPIDPTIGHLAVASLLGYLDLRFAGKWEAESPALSAWRDAFFARFADLAALRPAS